MSYCDGCSHIKVCGLEDIGCDAITFCEDRLLVEDIEEEMLKKCFSTTNPNNTYEFIDVIDVDAMNKILNKYMRDK